MNQSIVHFYGYRIVTTVTSDPNTVTRWITEVEHLICRNLVGLDIEWRPTFIRGHPQNPAATLQLCVGNRCLIFQLLHCRWIPESLITFLKTYTFVGVGIKGDLEKLGQDHGLDVWYSVDLRDAAGTAYRNAGLKELCSIFLLIEIVKPRHVTTSRWDEYYLSDEQVRYACLDAFVSLEIAVSLNVAGYGCDR